MLAVRSFYWIDHYFSAWSCLSLDIPYYDYTITHLYNHESLLHSITTALQQQTLSKSKTQLSEVHARLQLSVLTLVNSAKAPLVTLGVCQSWWRPHCSGPSSCLFKPPPPVFVHVPRIYSYLLLDCALSICFWK